MRSRHSSSESDNSCCRVPPDALHTQLRACSPSLHGCLSGAMAALVSLACCLSGNTKLCGDLRPADPKADSAVDEGVKLSLYRVSRIPGTLEPFQDLRRGPLGRQLRRARSVHRLVLRLAGARLPRSLRRSAVGIRARAMRFAASRSPICRDQHLIPESACPHVSSALAARSRCRDGQVLRARRGRREDPVLPNSLLPGRSTTMDKQLRRSSRLPAPDDRPSTNAGSHRRDRR